MKLPLHRLFGLLLKPNLRKAKEICDHSAFTYNVPYVYFYGILGFFLSVFHLRKHFGVAAASSNFNVDNWDTNKDTMVMHDLKIIATSAGILQYASLIMGCVTENPALFLPHLCGQSIVIIFKILRLVFLLPKLHMSFLVLIHKLPFIIIMTFNWAQEFCVFRSCLCGCDL